MSTDKLPPLELGDVAKITKLTKQRKLNGGKGFAYSYVKAVLGNYNDRTNDEITALATELRQAKKLTADMLKAKRTTKRK